MIYFWIIETLIFKKKITYSLLTRQNEVRTSDLLVKCFYDAKVQAELTTWVEVSDCEFCYASDNVKIQGNMPELRFTERC